jgi:peptide chain release factor subunit 1
VPEKVLLWEELDHMRYEIRNPVKDETRILYLTKAQEEDPKYFKDAESGIDLEIIAAEPLCDWLCVNYGNFGAKIELISDKTQEGFQFVKGFGGIGGILRYKVELEDHYDADGDLGGEDFDADEDFI